jgi:hypothetical protein
LPDQDYVGLFGELDGNNLIESGLIKNLKLTGANVKDTLADNCSTNVDVNGGTFVGGLIGDVESGEGTVVKNCVASGSVNGSVTLADGLIGINCSASIENCVASGGASGVERVGGLIGDNEYSDVKN